LRRAARVDANQVDVVKALRQCGAIVTPLHAVGHGVADLLVSYRQRWFLLEVKDGRKAPSAQKLTPDEKRWIGEQRAPVYIVKSPLEAISIVQSVR
jgi:hypothetical protein